jgi:hypothetical protein
VAPASPLLAGWHESQTIHLGWNAPFTVGPILGYDVEMSLDTFLTPGDLLPPVATSALTVSGRTNGTQYWFRVRATSAVGAGPWSDILGPIVPQPKPSIELAADTGSSPSDGITKNALINVAGVVPNAIWQYRVGTGAWTTGTGNVKGLFNNARELIDVPNEITVLHHRKSHSKNVCLLKCSASDHFLWNLTSDGDKRDRVHEGISDAGDEIRRARSGGGHTNADATSNTGVALSRKHATLLVTR